MGEDSEYNNGCSWQQNTYMPMMEPVNDLLAFSPMIRGSRY